MMTHIVYLLPPLLRRAQQHFIKQFKQNDLSLEYLYITSSSKRSERDFLQTLQRGRREYVQLFLYINNFLRDIVGCNQIKSVYNFGYKNTFLLQRTTKFITIISSQIIILVTPVMMMMIIVKKD